MYTSPTSLLPRIAYSKHERQLTLKLRVNESIKVFGSDDDTHPGVKYLLSTAKQFYVGGKVEAIQRLEHYDFLDLRCESAIAMKLW